MDTHHDPPPSFATTSPTLPGTAIIKPTDLLQRLQSCKPSTDNLTPSQVTLPQEPYRIGLAPFQQREFTSQNQNSISTSFADFPTSPPGPHPKLRHFPHDTTPLPPPTWSTTTASQASGTSAHRRSTIDRDALVSHQFGANGDEMQGKYEFPGAPISQVTAQLGSKIKEESAAKPSAKRHEQEQKQEQRPYFGSNSQTRVESVCPSPSKQNWLTNDHGKREEKRKGVTWGSERVEYPHTTIPKFRGWSDFTEDSGHGNANGWANAPPKHQLSAGEGDAQKGWSGWGPGDVDGEWALNVGDGRVFEDNSPAPGCRHVRSRHPSLSQGQIQGQRLNYGKASYRPSAMHFDAEQHCTQSNHCDNQGGVQPRQRAEGTSRPRPHHVIPLQETHTHYHQNANDNSAPTTQSQLQQKQAELIEVLGSYPAGKDDLATEQRIKIAVLENELKHANQRKEEAVNASVIIAQAMGSTLGLASGSQGRRVIEEGDSRDRDDEIREMKRQVQALMEENKMLWAGVRKRKAGGRVDESALENDAESLQASLRPVPDGRHLSEVIDTDDDAARPTANGKDKGRERVDPSKLGGLRETLKSYPTFKEETQAAYEKWRNDQKALVDHEKSIGNPSMGLSRAIEKASEPETEQKGVSGWNETFAIEIPTVPNSPVLHPVTANQSSETLMSDVGLHSLDEFLAGNMNKPPRYKGIPLSPQLEAQMRALQNMPSIPPPKILKTGFDIKDLKRGAEYGHLLPQPASSGGSGSFDRPNTADSSSKFSARDLWISPEEKERMLTYHRRQCGRDTIRYPDMFRYGIQYIPEEDDENYFRTVVISNLPGDVQLGDVLQRVRGGLVASAALTDTRCLMGGTMSVMVVFVEDYDAQAFVDYTSMYPITFTSDDDKQLEAAVNLVYTATYPMSHGMKHRMKVDRKNTRCLAINNVPENLSLSKLKHDISYNNSLRADNLLEIYLDDDDTLHLEFSNLSLAGSAYGILTNWAAYSGLKVAYAPDPCAGPLEELALPVPPRPPMLAHCRLPSPPYDPTSPSNSLHSSRLQGPGGNMIVTQRRSLAALSHQKVEIPSFSGAGIKSSSWADEVIESESDEPNAPSSSNLTYHMEQDEHDELAHPHSGVLPNSPIHGVLPVVSEPNLEIKEAVDAILTHNVNALMKENPSSFRKAPVGLAGSKHTTVVPGFSDHSLPLSDGNATRSHAKSLSPRESGDESAQGSDTDICKDHPTPTASEKGKGRADSPYPLPDFEPGNILASVLKSPPPQHSTQSASSSGLPLPKSPPSPREASKLFPTSCASSSKRTPKASSSYMLVKPSYVPERSLAVQTQSQRSPTRREIYPAIHSTPLEDFNVEFEAKKAAVAALHAPSTPPNQVITPMYPPFSQPAPRTPQKLSQNAGTKERYMELIELGLEVEVDEFEELQHEMTSELQLGNPASGAGGGFYAGVDIGPFLGGGNGDEEGAGKCGKEQALGGRQKEQINPDEIELDMDGDMEGAGARDGEHDSGRAVEEGARSRQRVNSDAHTVGYMSIGG